MRKQTEYAASRSRALAACSLAFVLLASIPLGSQPVEEPDPCAHAYGPR